LSERVAPKTALRKRFEYSRGLDPDAQLRECVEYLENPQILVAEFADSFLTAEAFDNRQEDFCAHGQTQIPKRRWVDHVVQKLIEHEDVTVRVDSPYEFRYLAREIIPLWSSEAKPVSDVSDRRNSGGGLDYVGMVCGEECMAVLGVVRPKDDPTPYLALLRVLTCLAEVSTETQMDRANRFLFKGGLPQQPTFDLHILCAEPLAASPHSLCALTRDLAHHFNVLLKEEWQFPNLVRNIACLTLSGDDFAGVLDADWCV
jgi:hypothetical protein